MWSGSHTVRVHLLLLEGSEFLFWISKELPSQWQLGDPGSFHLVALLSSTPCSHSCHTHLYEVSAGSKTMLNGGGQKRPFGGTNQCRWSECLCIIEGQKIWFSHALKKKRAQQVFALADGLVFVGNHFGLANIFFFSHSNCCTFNSKTAVDNGPVFHAFIDFSLLLPSSILCVLAYFLLVWLGNTILHRTPGKIEWPYGKIWAKQAYRNL